VDEKKIHLKQDHLNLKLVLVVLQLLLQDMEHKRNLVIYVS